MEINLKRQLLMIVEDGQVKQVFNTSTGSNEDYERDVWAGVIPLTLQPGQLTPDPKLTPGIEPSEAVRSWGR